MEWQFREITEDDARAIQAWRYPELYAVYNLSGGQAELEEMLDTRSPHFAVCDERGELIGFFGFGSSAEVGEGGEPRLYTSDGGLSVGLGMRPELAGQGLGLAYVEAGLAFARERFTPAYFRLFVLVWNVRAMRVYERVGFARTGSRTLTAIEGEREFIEMRRGADSGSADDGRRRRDGDAEREG